VVGAILLKSKTNIVGFIRILRPNLCSTVVISNKEYHEIYTIKIWQWLGSISCQNFNFYTGSLVPEI